MTTLLWTIILVTWLFVGLMNLFFREEYNRFDYVLMFVILLIAILTVISYTVKPCACPESQTTSIRVIKGYYDEERKICSQNAPQSIFNLKTIKDTAGEVKD